MYNDSDVFASDIDIDEVVGDMISSCFAITIVKKDGRSCQRTC